MKFELRAFLTASNSLSVVHDFGVDKLCDSGFRPVNHWLITIMSL